MLDDHCGMLYHVNDKLKHLRRYVRELARTRFKGKQMEFNALQFLDTRAALGSVPTSTSNTTEKQWPQLVSASLKEKLIAMCREETSSDKLREVTCAACAASVLATDTVLENPLHYRMELLNCPSDIMETMPQLHLPCVLEAYPQALLDPEGTVEVLGEDNDVYGRVHREKKLFNFILKKH